MYIFRPQNDTYNSFEYASLGGTSFVQRDEAQAVSLQYLNVSNGATATVKIQFIPNLLALQYDVVLNDIPLSDQGQEVTVNFKSFDINNHDNFTTDSNGLQMMERRLNYRATWNFSSDQNVTSNYYPVQTAVGIKDKHQDKAMIVMNSRSQAGGVIEQGRVELMQNRRMYYDDGRGMGEPLNETDEYDMGIIVPAQYIQRLYNPKKEQGLQREIQLHQDDPLQLFYSFDWESSHRRPLPKREEEPLSCLKSQKATVKYQLFPLAKNKVIFRIENIGDSYDGSNFDAYFNLTDIAKELFERANRG